MPTAEHWLQVHGDQIYIFLGGQTPSVLMDGEISSLLVGSAYVDRLMNGEALEED